MCQSPLDAISVLFHLIPGHVRDICQEDNYVEPLFRIRQIREYLTMDARYFGTCNYTSGQLKLFYEISDTDIKKQQRMQNCRNAKLVLQKGKYRLTTSRLRTPTPPPPPGGGQPVKLQVQFKIILTVQKYLLGNVSNLSN